jgi:phenylacetate-CoA ligase
MPPVSSSTVASSAVPMTWLWCAVVNLYPSAVEAVVRSVPEVQEYRVEVSRRGALAEVALAVECASEATPQKLATALAAAFSLRIPVRRVEALPRFELKARRWVAATES